MALYDPATSPEERLRFGEGAQPPMIRKAQPLASLSSTASGELSPSFIGGTIQPDSGNLVEGTLEGVKRGATVTPYPVKPASRLSEI